jgi:hypothetical protein
VAREAGPHMATEFGAGQKARGREGGGDDPSAVPFRLVDDAPSGRRIALELESIPALLVSWVLSAVECVRA